MDSATEDHKTSTFRVIHEFQPYSYFLRNMKTCGVPTSVGYITEPQMLGLKCQCHALYTLCQVQPLLMAPRAEVVKSYINFQSLPDRLLMN